MHTFRCYPGKESVLECTTSIDLLVGFQRILVLKKEEMCFSLAVLAQSIMQQPRWPGN